MGILTGIVIYGVGRRRGRKRAEKNFKRSASSPVFDYDDFELHEDGNDDEVEERHIVPLVIAAPSGPAHRPSHLTRGLR
jgi:hypothetical protein